jgi:polyferredoxin
VIVVAGMIGDQTPTRNLAPTAIWIAWWVGLSYLSAFVGNIWCVVNPWAALFEWCEESFSIQSVRRGARIGWPKTLGVWPATGSFIAFAWIELVWDGRSIPSRLAWLAIGFSAITWMGMLLFGRNTWLRYGDPFALAFSVLARFAPTEMRVATCVVDTRARTTGVEYHRPRGTCGLRLLLSSGGMQAEMDLAGAGSRVAFWVFFEVNISFVKVPRDCGLHLDL